MRLPFGINSAGEIWQRAMIEEFGDLEGVEIVVDDVLIWAENIAQHDERLEKFLDRVRKVGLKLNDKKSVICTQQVEYVGHLLTSEGLRPSPDRNQSSYRNERTTKTCRTRNFPRYHGISW